MCVAAKTYWKNLQLVMCRIETAKFKNDIR